MNRNQSIFTEAYRREREIAKMFFLTLGEFILFILLIVMLIVSLFTPDLRYYANDFGGNNGALIHFVQSTLEAALAGDQA